MAHKILVIDDDPIMRRLFFMILNVKDYQVQTVSSVDRGLEEIEQQVPDLICCDLMMPDTTGIDFLKERQQSTKLSNIPVIIISAAGDEDQIQLALSLGAFGCLAKPFSRGQLLTMVESALDETTR